jgi:hypothetical protein
MYIYNLILSIYNKIVKNLMKWEILQVSVLFRSEYNFRGS